MSDNNRIVFKETSWKTDSYLLFAAVFAVVVGIIFALEKTDESWISRLFYFLVFLAVSIFFVWMYFSPSFHHRKTRKLLTPNERAKRRERIKYEVSFCLTSNFLYAPNIKFSEKNLREDVEQILSEIIKTL